jgi:hypothetical protein
LPILKKYGTKPSYIAIRKALYGSQPGIFVSVLFSLLLQVSISFEFTFYALAVARELVLVYLV